MTQTRSFASDNFSGVHPEVMDALLKANQGHAMAYGGDPYSEAAIAKFKALFGEDTEVFFTFNGTGANVVGLASITRSFNAIICPETAHIQVDECGAPDKFTGCKLLTVPAPNGKLTVDLIKTHMHGFGSEHHSQPKVISLSQCTELGTVYSPEELTAICDFAHSQGLYVQMDGARLANAVVSLGLDAKAISRDCGVDVLSFGGTKNGMMFGEAILFFNPQLTENTQYLRKQATQLPSKMRFIGAQFEALLTDDLWLRSARHANKMAKKLEQEVRKIPAITITQSVDSNGIWALVPKAVIPQLQAACFFWMWDEERGEVRWMCSFDTTEEDIISFVTLLRKHLL